MTNALDEEETCTTGNPSKFINPFELDADRNDGAQGTWYDNGVGCGGGGGGGINESAGINGAWLAL